MIKCLIAKILVMLDGFVTLRVNAYSYRLGSRRSHPNELLEDMNRRMSSQPMRGRKMKSSKRHGDKGTLRDCACLPCARGKHGKGRFPLGKVFAECNTRQTAHGIQRPAKSLFVVCYILGTRQTFCRVLFWAHGKIKYDARNPLKRAFAVCRNGVAHGKQAAVCRVPGQTAVCQGNAHGKKWHLCCVPWPWHTANVLFRLFFLK